MGEHSRITLQCASTDEAGGSPLNHIAVIGNAMPRRCGLASFRSHIVAALRQRFPLMRVDHYAMDDGTGIAYPDGIHPIAANDPQARVRLREVERHLPGAVRAVVIDDDELVCFTEHRGEQRLEALHERAEIHGLVARRNDERQAERSAIRSHRGYDERPARYGQKSCRRGEIVHGDGAPLSTI